MKKSLKLVGIFMVVLLVGVVGGISLYFLIANNKTYYIYDVRIVEPVKDESYYVYTNNEASYTTMKNKVVYMTTPEDNNFEIGIYAHTSTNTTRVDITSSNPNVATVSSSNGRLFVNYKGAGETEIIASIGKAVQDSIKVTVYDVSAEELAVFDDRYYGEDYSKYFANKIVAYADDMQYTYRIETANMTGGEFSDNVNSELLAIDYTQIDRNIFKDNSDVQIDSVNKTLILKCNSEALLDNADTIIPIQAFAKTADGELRVSKNYFVQVHIITYTPKFLQIVLSKSPHFDEGVVLMNTSSVDVSNFTDEEIFADPSILDEFLNFQIEKSGLINKENSEIPAYNAYFTNKVSKIYVQFRKVYTNGDIVYLNPLTMDGNKNSHTITFNGANYNSSPYVALSADKTYYILTLSEANFNSFVGGKFKISVSLGDYDLSHIFEFEFYSLTADNIFKYYEYNSDNNTYKFTYWDERSRYSEIYNENGEIVGFSIGGNVVTPIPAEDRSWFQMSLLSYTTESTR